MKSSKLQGLEVQRGFKAGALQKHGATLYFLDALLSHDAENIVPFSTTAWSGGVTPGEFYVLSEKCEKVGYHKNYPSEKTPIFQYKLQSDVRTIVAPRFLERHDHV